MSYDKLNDEISKYQLSLFSPSNKIKPEYTDFYKARDETKKQNSLSHSLLPKLSANTI